jgi:hypothetical protein
MSTTTSISPGSLQPPLSSTRSTFSQNSYTERDFDTEIVADLTDQVLNDNDGEEAVHFVLLAEFDIDAGATLAHQYPYPTGTDEQ